MKGNKIMRMTNGRGSLHPHPSNRVTMDRSRFRYGALGVIAAAAFLTGCSSTSSSLGPPAQASLRGATTQSNLLYIGARHKVRVLEFPDGHSVSDLRLQFGILGGLCSDPSGDVYLDEGQWTYEFAHGGTHSIASVVSPFGFPYQCAFDATTGNLAVITGTSKNDEIAVYEHFTGKAHEYPPNEILNDCSYDGSGDLFVTTPWALAELPKGAKTFTSYTPKLKSADSELTGIQWDGTYLVVQETQPSKAFTFLDRITIDHKHVKIVSRTKLVGSNIAFKSLFSSIAVGLYGPAHNEIGFWNYPAGGKPLKLLDRFKVAFYAATVSAAPSR
jgi:hypothetical protein